MFKLLQKLSWLPFVHCYDTEGVIANKGFNYDTTSCGHGEWFFLVPLPVRYKAYSIMRRREQWGDVHLVRTDLFGWCFVWIEDSDWDWMTGDDLQRRV